MPGSRSPCGHRQTGLDLVSGAGVLMIGWRPQALDRVHEQVGVGAQRPLVLPVRHPVAEELMAEVVELAGDVC